MNKIGNKKFFLITSALFYYVYIYIFFFLQNLCWDFACRNCTCIIITNINHIHDSHEEREGEKKKIFFFIKEEKDDICVYTCIFIYTQFYTHWTDLFDNDSPNAGLRRRN